MPERIFHRQWREEQGDSRYPFSDNATLISGSGQTLDKSVFVDGSIYPIGGTARMFLSTINVTVDEITMYIGTLANNRLCSGTFDPLDPPTVITFEDEWGRAAGVLVADAILLASFQSWEEGDYEFTQTTGELAAAACIPTPEIGVRGLVTEDGELFTGDVWITGEYGVVVREDTTESTNGTRVIRIDVVGDPMYRRVLCEGTAQGPLGPVDLFQSINYLKTINGIPPNEYGDWQVTAGGNESPDTVLRIYPTPEGVKFEVVGEKAVE